MFCKVTEFYTGTDFHKGTEVGRATGFVTGPEFDT